MPLASSPVGLPLRLFPCLKSRSAFPERAVLCVRGGAGGRMCMRFFVCVSVFVRLQVLFIESICDDPAVLEANLQHKVKSSPDFVGGVTPSQTTGTRVC